MSKPKGSRLLELAEDMEKEKRIDTRAEFDERVKKERNRLNRNLKVENKNKKLVNAKLIDRAAFTSILLEDLEDDLANNGYVELFSQSENAAPYERERPSTKIYNTTLKTYQSLIRQLSSLFEVDVSEIVKKEDEDSFDSFANLRAVGN